MKHSCIVFIAILMISASLSAGTGGTVTGLVIDAGTGEPLIAANVVVIGKNAGSASDLNGAYQILNLPPGEYSVRASMVGYNPEVQEVILLPGQEIRLDFTLAAETLEAVPEIVIAAEKLVEGASVSDIALSPRMLKSKDGLMEDPVKVVQTLPGIASSGDPLSPGQLYVRGGAPEENLFMLDWAKVYFPWFSGGLKSVFNSQITEDIELLTGGFPPKYGNCLSSVLSVTTRDGNRERYAGGVSLGIMTSQGLIEGPINERSSFLVTVRRTFLDLLMADEADFPVPSFYDYNIKLNYDLDAKHNLDFTAFSSNEKYDFASENPDAGIPPLLDIDMHADTQTLELNSIFTRKLYSKLALTHSYIESHVKGGTVYDVNSRPELYSIRQDITLKPDPRHEIKTGFEFSYNDYYMHSTMPLDPSDTYTSWDSAGMPLDVYDFSGNYALGGAYVQDSYTIVPPLTLTGGFRADYDFAADNPDVMPRLSARYELTEKTALRLAWGEYRMFKDRMFLQENRKLNSDKAVHYILGLNHEFSRSLSGWIEIYYKDYAHLTVVDSTGNFTDDGNGYSQGIEFFLQKKLGAFTGWVNYSLSKSQRREYLDDKQYDFDYDQTHIANLVLEYNFPREQKWLPDIIGTNFRFYTGRPYTPTVAADSVGFGNFIPVKGETNSVRYGDFHALSVRMEWRFPVFRTAKGKFYLEAWNLYDRKNEMGVTYVYGNEYPANADKRPYYSTPFLLGGGLGIDF